MISVKSLKITYSTESKRPSLTISLRKVMNNDN